MTTNHKEMNEEENKPFVQIEVILPEDLECAVKAITQIQRAYSLLRKVIEQMDMAQTQMQEAHLWGSLAPEMLAAFTNQAESLRRSLGELVVSMRTDLTHPREKALRELACSREFVQQELDCIWNGGLQDE